MKKISIQNLTRALVAMGMATLLVSCTPTPAAPQATQSTARPTNAAPTPSPAPNPTPAPPVTRADLVGLSQSELNSRLWNSAWANDVSEAEQLIIAGADVNAKDSTMQSAYLVATSEGYLDLLNLTLKHGADVTSLDSYNGTGLIRAAERGHAAVVGRLIQAGIPLDHVNYPGYVALHEALIYAKPDQVEAYQDTVWVLVAAGSDLTIPVAGTGESSLALAQRFGLARQTEILRRAINTPVAPARADQLLLQAAQTGDPDLAALALRAGASVNTVDKSGTSALALAEAGAHGVTARLLANLGATK